MHFKSSKSSLLLLVTDIYALLRIPLLPPPPICSVPLFSPSLAAAQFLFSPLFLHISQLQISSRKCLVLEGSSWSSQRKNYQQPHQLLALRVKEVNSQLLLRASRLSFAMSTRCTERRQACILPDFTASSLQAQFKMSCLPAIPPWALESLPSSGEATMLQFATTWNFSQALKMHTKFSSVPKS